MFAPVVQDWARLSFGVSLRCLIMSLRAGTFTWPCWSARLCFAIVLPWRSVRAFADSTCLPALVHLALLYLADVASYLCAMRMGAQTETASTHAEPLVVQSWGHIGVSVTFVSPVGADLCVVVRWRPWPVIRECMWLAGRLPTMFGTCFVWPATWVGTMKGRYGLWCAVALVGLCMRFHRRGSSGRLAPGMIATSHRCIVPSARSHFDDFMVHHVCAHVCACFIGPSIC